MTGKKMVMILFYKWTLVYIIYASIHLSRKLILYKLQRILFSLCLYIYIWNQPHTHTYTQTHISVHMFILDGILITQSSKWRITISVHVNIILNCVFIFFLIPQGETICWVALTVYIDAEVVFLLRLFQL